MSGFRKPGHNVNFTEISKTVAVHMENLFRKLWQIITNEATDMIYLLAGLHLFNLKNCICSLPSKIFLHSYI